jgi:hypothetical protein
MLCLSLRKSTVAIISTSLFFLTISVRADDSPPGAPLSSPPSSPLVAASVVAPGAEKSGPQPIQLLRVSAKTISTVLAQSCTDSGWQAFSVAAQAAGYMNYKFKDTYDVWPSAKGLRIEAEGLREKAEATIGTKGALTVVADGRTYLGVDACEVIAAYLKDAPTLDDKGTLVLTVAMLAGTSQLTIARAPADLSGVTAAIFLSLDAARRGSARLDLNRVLDANYSVKCTDTIATIQTAVHKFIVHRNRGAKSNVHVFDRETDYASNIDQKSVFAVHAKAYLAAMTENCKKSKDAEKLQQVATDTLEDAQVRAASLEPVGPERQPASEK